MPISHGIVACVYDARRKGVEAMLFASLHAPARRIHHIPGGDRGNAAAFFDLLTQTCQHVLSSNSAFIIARWDANDRGPYLSGPPILIYTELRSVIFAGRPLDHGMRAVCRCDYLKHLLESLFEGDPSYRIFLQGIDTLARQRLAESLFMKVSTVGDDVVALIRSN